MNFNFIIIKFRLELSPRSHYPLVVLVVYQQRTFKLVWNSIWNSNFELFKRWIRSCKSMDSIHGKRPPYKGVLKICTICNYKKPKISSELLNQKFWWGKLKHGDWQSQIAILNWKSNFWNEKFHWKIWHLESRFWIIQNPNLRYENPWFSLWPPQAWHCQAGKSKLLSQKSVFKFIYERNIFKFENKECSVFWLCFNTRRSLWIAFFWTPMSSMVRQP